MNTSSLAKNGMNIGKKDNLKNPFKICVEICAAPNLPPHFAVFGRQRSISSTFYEQMFRAKVLCAAFL